MSAWNDMVLRNRIIKRFIPDNNGVLVIPDNDVRPSDSVSNSGYRPVQRRSSNYKRIIFLLVIVFSVTTWLNMSNVDYTTKKIHMEQKFMGNYNTEFAKSHIERMREAMFRNWLIEFVLYLLFAVIATFTHEYIGGYTIFMCVYLYTCYCIYKVHYTTKQFFEYTGLNCYRNRYHEEIAMAGHGILSSFGFKW